MVSFIVNQFALDNTAYQDFCNGGKRRNYDTNISNWMHNLLVVVYFACNMETNWGRLLSNIERITPIECYLLIRQILFHLGTAILLLPVG